MSRPNITRHTLLAGLQATREADAEARCAPYFARAASPTMRVKTRSASSALNVISAVGSGSGSIMQPTAYIATASASSSSMLRSLPLATDERGRVE